MNYVNDLMLQEALSTDILKEINRFKKQVFVDSPLTDYKTLECKVMDYFSGELGYPLEIVKQAYKIIRSSYARRKRCLDKTTNIVNANKTVFFGTLTFTNEVLETTSVETRRRYVSRYLKSISNSYIANIDFGDKEKNPDSNEREHYHCLIATDVLPCSWSYGFCNFKKVGNQNEDAERISKYIAKLTNHALKVEKTGKSRRLIYSRGFVAPHWLLE